MNKSINLKSFIEVYENHNKDLINSYLKLINNSDDSEISMEEVKDLYSMLKLNDITTILELGQQNGYFLNYTIKTGIREQFDVLRFSEDSVLNIELKSQLPKNEYEDIRNQLIRHKFILNTLNKSNVFCCTYVKSENKLYFLNAENELTLISYNDLSQIIEHNYLKRLELLDVNLSHLIISPYSQPNDFVAHNYFLTNEQLHVRNKILASEQNKFALIGGPGTGKTMVLFDMARKYVNQGKKVLILFSAMMNDAEIISNILKIDIRSIRDFNKIIFNDYDIILVDEAQRLWQGNYEYLIQLSNHKVIFSVDHKQTLHPEEKRINIEQQLIDNPNVIKKKLKDKIRTDPAMSSFIQKLLNLRARKIQVYDYKKVQVIYFDNKHSARDYIEYMYKNENYISIELTEYITKSFGNKKRTMIYSESETAHSVIGREYDNVLVPLDKHFYYLSEGTEAGKLASNYDDSSYYPYNEDSCIFEALTRVKENLLIVVIDNPVLYKVIQEILTWKLDTEKVLT